MTKAFFVSDLHGSMSRYKSLWKEIVTELPDLVLMGGDMLPHGFGRESPYDNFINQFIVPGFIKLKNKLGKHYPAVFVILGNDDAAFNEKFVIEAENTGIWKYINFKIAIFSGFRVYGYCYVPPTPFRLKDWERYDVSRYVDPGSIPLEDGFFSIDRNKDDLLYGTIQQDIESLTKEDFEPSLSIFLFHSPPYNTKLDRAGLDGMMIDHVPIDVHVGSIAIKKFIDEKQPFITLHGHIHESTRLTGVWYEKFNDTHSFLEFDTSEGYFVKNQAHT